MGGTGQNIDITKQVEASAVFCNQLNDKKDTLSDFLFLIDWLEAAAKKKKGKERKLHVAKLSKSKWDEKLVPVLVGKDTTHDVPLKTFVDIYCDMDEAPDEHAIILVHGAKRYSSLYEWVKNQCKSLRADLPDHVLQLSRTTSSTFANLTNVIAKSDQILGGTPKIEEEGLVGKVKNKRMSVKEYKNKRNSVGGDQKSTQDEDNSAPGKAAVPEKKLNESAKKDKWIDCNGEGTHFMTYLVKYDDYKTLPEKKQDEKYNTKYDETKFVNEMKKATAFTWLLGNDNEWHTVEEKPNLNDKKIYQIAFGKKGTKLNCWAMLIPAGKLGSKELRDLRTELGKAGVKMAHTLK